MEYREDRKGQRLSILGYGCMRFTKNGSAVDLDKAEQELMYAMCLLYAMPAACRHSDGISLLQRKIF